MPAPFRAAGCKTTRDAQDEPAGYRELSQMKQSPAAILLWSLVLTGLAGCSGSDIAGSLQSANTGETASAAVRSTPVVPGRAARVFVFASIGENCEPVAAPEITVTEPPAKGDVTFVPGQQTTIQYSLKGTCTGQKTTGTGVYYTARAGQVGADRFSVLAKLPNGEPATRTFDVKIAE
jgi:hypothetical protein